MQTLVRTPSGTIDGANNPSTRTLIKREHRSECSTSSHTASNGKSARERLRKHAQSCHMGLGPGPNGVSGQAVVESRRQTPPGTSPAGSPYLHMKTTRNATPLHSLVHPHKCLASSAGCTSLYCLITICCLADLPHRLALDCRKTPSVLHA